MVHVQVVTNLMDKNLEKVKLQQQLNGIIIRVIYDYLGSGNVTVVLVDVNPIIS